MQDHFLPVTFCGRAGAFVNGSQARWTRRWSCPWTEPATCIPLIKGHYPRSRPLLEFTQLHSLTAWSCMELDSCMGEEIIAIDQREEVRRPQDKLLCWWMTSIFPPVTLNNEHCWGGTNAHLRIYGSLLCLSGANRVTGCATCFYALRVCTCAHPLQRILSEQQGDQLLSIRRRRVLSLWPVDLVWKHTAHPFELEIQGAHEAQLTVV